MGKDLITIEVCEDAALIESAVKHPRIWPHVHDDGTADPEAFNPFASNALWLAAYSSGEFMGCFMYHAHNSTTMEMHTCLLPKAWGASDLYARKSVEWIFANTPCRRIITNVPDGNKLAERLAKRVGFVEFGYNPNSIQKGGRLVGQKMLGISKGHQSCQ